MTNLKQQVKALIAKMIQAQRYGFSELIRRCKAQLDRLMTRFG